MAVAACVGVAPESDSAPRIFYTVTGEIALSRHEPRVAALEYAAAAEGDSDVGLLRRAVEVTAECLQPSLTVEVARRWIGIDPAAVDAHRAAGNASLALHRIEQSASHYHMVLTSSPRGADAGFADLETLLAATDNVYGARQLADRLAARFPSSPAALRMQAFAAMRADDPAAAVDEFRAAMAAHEPASNERRELTEGLWRARVLAGDSDEPLEQAQLRAERDASVENRLEYVLLLMAAQQTAAARAQLTLLTQQSEASPIALRLLGLLDFQEGDLDDAGVRFAQLLTTGKFLDDAIYYLGLIAERHDDWERALRFYAQVQAGDNEVSALLRAVTILRAHGAAPAAEELLDRLIEEEPRRAPEILASRARIYAEAGDLAQAIEVLRQGELQYPDSVELRYAMASMFEEQGNVTVALRELKAVATLRPDDPAALNAYGYTLADHHRRLGVARKLIEQAYAVAPKSAAIEDSLGWVLFRQGQAERALQFLTVAYTDDRGGDIAAHLGEVLWQLGRRADAERIWAEASRTDVSNRLLKTTRARLHASP